MFLFRVYANTTSTAARTSSENVIISQLFKVITLAKCVLTIRELNWNQRFTDKRTKFNIFVIIWSRSPHNCKTGHFTSQKERERLRNVKNENCTCKACKTIVFHCQICKFVTFLLPSSSWLRKLSFEVLTTKRAYSSKFLILCLYMKTICAKQTKVNFAYFVKRD